MKRFLPLLLLAAPAGAQVVRAITSEAAVSGVAAVSIAAVPLTAPSAFAGVALLSVAAAPSASVAGAPAAAAAADPQAALVEKIGARLCGANCVDRRKSAQWIGEIAREHPREPVQAAAVRVLGEDAVRAGDMIYFEQAVAAIESFAGTTEHDAVYEDAVRRLVDAARRSGGSQARAALSAAERLGRAGTLARRARAAELIGSLRSDKSVRWDPDAVEGAVARLNAPAR